MSDYESVKHVAELLVQIGDQATPDEAYRVIVMVVGANGVADVAHSSSISRALVLDLLGEGQRIVGDNLACFGEAEPKEDDS